MAEQAGFVRGFLAFDIKVVVPEFWVKLGSNAATVTEGLGEPCRGPNKVSELDWMMDWLFEVDLELGTAVEVGKAETDVPEADGVFGMFGVFDDGATGVVGLGTDSPGLD
jgi:hypothetical protein